MIDNLKHMKESLMCCAMNQMNHLERVDTKELGECIDMIKDLEEAIYYNTITEAMNKNGKDWDNGNEMRYYQEPGRMYYMGGNPKGNHNSGNNNSNHNISHDSDYSSNNMSSNGHREYEYPMEMRDHREGRSPRNRRMYMEAQQSHADKTTQMRELEKYMQELSQDLIEMIENASTEERQYLEKKLNVLSSKIAQMN